MTEEELQAIEARAAAATPGPWILMPETCGPDGQEVYESEDLGCICSVGDPYPRGQNHPQENMEFISAARSDVPALVAEVRRLRAELAALSGALAYPNFDIERLEDGRYEASCFEGKDPLGNRNAWAVGATPLEALRVLAAKWERGE